jgi:ADP-heptose:LPS heptosyltransferase/SAM-dependent methyltransferase
MRILACNPDTLGDLVLRQPLYAALRSAGHELTLIVRPSVADTARLVAPQTPLIELPAEVYADVDANWNTFEPTVDAALASEPDLLLIAPYQWTRFEERLAARLRERRPGIRVVGFNGHLYAGDPHAGHAAPSTLRMDETATVDPSLPEAEKNAALASVLGCAVSQVDPLIVPTEDALAAARTIVAERGMEPGGFWIACVTGTAHVSIKAWPEDRWAAALSGWQQRSGARFLFVGLPDERGPVERIRLQMGYAGTTTGLWMEPNGSVATLAALTALSAGYVGHDTGPMHIAAAVGNPVLAVFGGGHGMRFAPRVTPSVAISVRVPCSPCGWMCSFETSHCVKEVPVEAVLEAADDLEAGRVRSAEQRLLPLPHEVHVRMTRFAADLARDRLRDLGDSRLALESAKATTLHERTESQRALRRLTEEAAGLQQQLADRELAAQSLRQAVVDADARTAAEADARQREATQLRADAESLRQQLIAADAARADWQKKAETADRELQNLRAQEQAKATRRTPRVRRPLRERVIDLVCGQRHYTPRSVPPPMPKICVVTRVRPGDADDSARRTIESVLAEQYPHLEYVLAGDAGRSIVAEYAPRVAKVLPPGDQPFAGVADAFAKTDADVICWLDVGMVYEPGALMRAGEYFRDHSMAMAAAFENTADIEACGWRFQNGRAALDIETLRLADGWDGAHVFFRRQAYALLGALKPALREAADWDLLIRFARRFGIRRADGHSHCFHTFAHRDGGLKGHEADVATARQQFEPTYGPLGRVRGRLLATLADWQALAERRPTARWRWPWPPYAIPSQRYVATEAEHGVLPSGPGGHRRPTRFLFCGPDVAAGDLRLWHAYYCADDDAAVAFPPVDATTLADLHDRRAKLAGSPVVPARSPHDVSDSRPNSTVMDSGSGGLQPQQHGPDYRTVPPEAGADFSGTGDTDRPQDSPYQGKCRGSRWLNALAGLPSPYWKLTGRKAGGESDADRLLSLVGRGVARDSSTRALVVGCFDGTVLDELKQRTPWQLYGIETNEQAMEAARRRGHHVWLASPQDAFMTLPDGEVFDLLFVPNMLEHWDDPAWVIRRLVRLMSPTGRLVVRTPNLDSVLLDRFGPTWWHWQLPHHRVLFGRRGLRQLAAACDLKVDRLKTVTDAYAAAASVQLNRVGLAGVVPEGAAFDADVSAEGARLAGWARMLWDPRGRGDEMWAVLRPM